MPMQEGIKRLVDEVTGWAGVTSHPHRFGGTEFRVGKGEIGHVHNFGIVDIPFTVGIRQALVKVGRGEPHHWLPDSGWTTVRIIDRDASQARMLLRLSYLRIQAKGASALASCQARNEFESLRLEPEVLEAAGVRVPGTQR